MKVKARSNDHLRLSGVPNGFGWMLLMFVFSAGMGAVAVTLLFRSKWPGDWYRIVVLCMSLVIPILPLLLFSLHALVSCESLELVRSKRTGEYRRWSYILGTRKAVSFSWDRIHAVTVEGYTETGGAGRRASFPKKCLRCRLLLTDPREAIQIDDTQNHRHDRVRALAEEVAAFTDRQVTESVRTRNAGRA